MMEFRNNFLSLDGSGNEMVIPTSPQGQMHRTHPYSRFKLIQSYEQLASFMSEAKPFALCQYRHDYIILQMMQMSPGTTMVEYLLFGESSGSFTDPTLIDLAPWLPVDKYTPMDGQRVLAYVCEKTEKGECLYATATVKVYNTQKGFGFNDENIKVLYWKPISFPNEFTSSQYK